MKNYAKKAFVSAFAAGAIVFGLTACGVTHTYEAEPVDGERCFAIEREDSNGNEVALGTYCNDSVVEDDDYEEPESEYYDD